MSEKEPGPAVIGAPKSGVGRRRRRARVALHAAHGCALRGVIVLAYMLGQLGNALPLPGGVGGVGGVETIMLRCLPRPEAWVSGASLR